MSSESNQYFNTLNKILHDVVGNALRDVFKKEWNSLFSQSQWKDDQNNLHDFENKEKNGPNWRSNKSRMPDTGNCSEWDLTKLFFVLLYSHTIDLKSRDPRRYDNIDQIRKIRNHECHPKSAGLSKAEFEVHFNNIKKNLNALGCSDAVKEMELVKDRDKVATKKDIRILWMAMFVVSCVFLAFFLYSVISNGFKPSSQDAQRSMISNRSPNRAYFPDAVRKPTYFKGRDKEIAEISNCFINGSHPIVNIIGSPAFGKTSLSIAVGQNLRDNHGFQIVFVELRGINASTDSSKQALLEKVTLSLGVNKSSIAQEDPKYSLAKHILEQETLLILDNAEDALIPPMKEHFLELVKDMMSISGIKVLCTSRKRFDIIGTSIFEVCDLMHSA